MNLNQEALPISFADHALRFNQQLSFEGALPDGIKMMNPFESKKVQEITQQFYRKYYQDNNHRHIILGINPGRHGAGLTGIPFTDSKRLEQACGIDPQDIRTHELSSVYIYELIDAYGGCNQFYKDFYINSPCPLGLLTLNSKGKWVNCNYFDSKAILSCTQSFIEQSMLRLLGFPIYCQSAVVLGRGKNLETLNKLNEIYGWFNELIGVEHPRFVMQYRSKQKSDYIAKTIHILQELTASQ